MAHRLDGKKNALTLRFRELGGLVRIAGDLAVQNSEELVKPEHVHRAKPITRGIEQGSFSRGPRQTKTQYEDYFF